MEEVIGLEMLGACAVCDFPFGDEFRVCDKLNCSAAAFNHYRDSGPQVGEFHCFSHQAFASCVQAAIKVLGSFPLRPRHCDFDEDRPLRVCVKTMGKRMFRNLATLAVF